MGQSIGRGELERRRLLAAGMVTVAGAEDGAAGELAVPFAASCSRGRGIRRPFFLSILFEALIGNRSAPGQVLQLVLGAAHFRRAERITDLNL